MRFIMTGHKGLIGSFFLRRLVDRGDEPVLLIDKKEGNDISDIRKTKLEEVDTMVHLASFCKINRAIDEPRLAFESNINGMFEVMEFC